MATLAGVDTVSPVPTAVRSAGVVVAVQGAAALLVAAALVVRGLSGADQRVVGGISLAICFGLIGAGVLGAGWALTHGKRWGRGVAVFANLLLLPVAWYVAIGSQQWGYGIPIGGVALAVLGLLFSPAALRWLTLRPSPPESTQPGLPVNPSATS